MPRTSLALLLALFLERAASACSCVGPHGESQKLEAAKAMARDAVAIVEAVEIEPINLKAMRAELYRVTRVHVGDVPATFRGVREFRRHPGGLVEPVIFSCDAAPGADKPSLIVLYSADRRSTFAKGGSARKVQSVISANKEPAFEIGITCSHLFLSERGMLARVKAEARKLGRLVRP